MSKEAEARIAARALGVGRDRLSWEAGRDRVGGIAQESERSVVSREAAGAIPATPAKHYPGRLPAEHPPLCWTDGAGWGDGRRHDEAVAAGAPDPFYVEPEDRRRGEPSFPSPDDPSPPF